MSTIHYRRGDIVLVYIPFADLQHVKKRPALVVQDDHASSDPRRLVVAQITSQSSHAHQPTCVTVSLSSPLATGTGLLKDSVIVTDFLATIETDLIYRTLGRLSDLRPVDQALKLALGLT
jgi:mRNA interferase MazF